MQETQNGRNFLKQVSKIQKTIKTNRTKKQTQTTHQVPAITTNVANDSIITFQTLSTSPTFQNNKILHG